MNADPEAGIAIALNGVDDGRSVSGELSFAGNLGALCPGSYVELRRDGDALVPVEFGGPRMDELAGLQLLARFEMIPRVRFAGYGLVPWIAATGSIGGFALPW